MNQPKPLIIPILQATTLADIQTECEGNIKDVQFDYYGARLAACDTTGKIVIQDQVEITGRNCNKLGMLSHTDNLGREHTNTISNAHEGAVAQIDWAHPE